MTLQVTEEQWRLIMKSLAFLAGLKVAVKLEDQEAAAALNESFLLARLKAEKKL